MLELAKFVMSKAKRSIPSIRLFIDPVDRLVAKALCSAVFSGPGSGPTSEARFSEVSVPPLVIAHW